nr:hypothetical protein [Methylomonas koyamae]
MPFPTTDHPYGYCRCFALAASVRNLGRVLSVDADCRADFGAGLCRGGPGVVGVVISVRAGLVQETVGRFVAELALFADDGVFQRRVAVQFVRLCGGNAVDLATVGIERDCADLGLCDRFGART